MAHYQPSTEWREQIAPDEEQRFAQYAQDFMAMQTRKSQKYGTGRGLHRKQILGLPAHFSVLESLPEFAHAGLFSQPNVYPALVRLSNGAPHIGRDSTPDIRGFAIKIRGIRGAGALGSETTEQDFLLINREVFGLKDSAEFVSIVKASEGGQAELVKHLMCRNGLWGGFKKLISLQKSMQQPFHGFATHTFFSSAPIALGKYAIRLRLVPESGNGKPASEANDWKHDVLSRLAHNELAYTMQVQFFISEALTPIEDASINWSEEISPYYNVARLIIPQHNEWEKNFDTIQSQAEQGIFDPWCALAEHRPLGDVMRARKVVYFASQQNRNAQSSVSL